VSHSASIKLRLAISVGANTLRAIIGFATSLLIARALDPDGYGDLLFLLGSFAAFRSLLDLGSSNAFFTFLSRRARGRRFYQIYFFWLMFQFMGTLLLVEVIIPSSVFDRIWLGHNREVVLLAFVAVFMQQQIWQTVVQIGEAMRKTVQVQFMNLTVALVYLTVVLLVLEYGQLTVELALLILSCQYSVAVVAVAVAYRYLKKDIENPVAEDKSSEEILKEFWQYCKPMMVLAIIGFMYDFMSKWMLQKFGGSAQQGFFQIANQFAAVSLFATSSILNVFWKEIAHAWEMQDRGRVAILYQKVSRGLVMLGACISGLLLPWSEQLVSIFLGAAYTQAWPVLAIMLLYPIYQSMGQIGGVMLLARGFTKQYMYVSVATMLISIPATYIILAPPTGILPGLEMGALGMASQLVVLAVGSVNIQAWVISRCGGWKFDWASQIVVIPIMIGIGVAVKYFIGRIWVLENVGIQGLILPVAVTIAAYLFIVSTVIWQFPWLVGFERVEFRRMFSRILRKTI
jgi:O-antigen/teichoic acid export membrane protein